MPRGATSPARLNASIRQLQALELRRGGATYDQIARQLGYAGSSPAYKAVITAIRESLHEPKEELAKLELHRLDAMQLALWPAALRGDVQAVTAVLRIMQRRATMLGLDQPRSHDLQQLARRWAVEAGLDEDEVLAAAEEIVRLGQL